MPDRSVNYTFTAKFDSFKASLAAGGRSVDDFGKKLTSLDAQGAKARQGLAHFGDLGGKIALGATAGLAAIVGVTANFEKAMSSVKAATGEGEEGMKALREAAIQAGADTAFSASEAAAGIENLAKAGVSVQDILGGGLQGALDLAAAGQIDVAVAAEAAASAMTQFGLAGEDVPHIADLLAAAAGKAQGEVTDMASALNQSGLIAAQVGLSIEETAGGLAAFASAGLLGSDAGTSFKTMLGALTPNSAKAKTAMDELGISAYDAQGNFIGLSEFAGNLQAGLADLTDEQRQATLETIFGSDAVRAASILYEQGAGGIQTWIDKTNDAGFAAEQAETKLDNLAGDFEALKGSLETALIGAGEGSQGPLRKMVQGFTDVVNAFNKLPGPAQGAVTALLGVTAVLGGGLWFTSKVVQGIADTREALSNLGVTAGRTRGVLAGVAKAGAGLLVFEAATFAIDQLMAQLKTPINPGTLSRDLESLADGRVTTNLQDMSTWLDDIGDKWERDYNPIAILSPLDMSGYEDAERGLGAIDEQLAAMVESGNAEQAAAAFAQIQKEADAAGHTISGGSKYFEEYRTALTNAGLAADPLSTGLAALQGPVGDIARDLLGVGEAAEGAAGPTDDLAGSTEGLGDEAGDTSTSIKDLVSAMLAQRDAALAAFDAETAYRQALKAANEQAKDNNAGIAGNTEKALANRDALSGLASAWNSQSVAVRNNVEKYREARTSFLDVAAAMGVPIKKAIELADALFAVPKKTVTALEANDKASAKVVGVQRLVDYYGQTRASAQALLKDLASGKVKTVQGLVNKYGLTKAEAEALLRDLASGKLREVINLINAVDGKHAVTTIETVRLTRYKTLGSQGIGPDRTGAGIADGGTVPGQRQPYGDKVLAYLAPGEEVITNRRGEADQFRADRAAGRIPHYADGTGGGLPGAATRGGDNETERQSRATGQALKGLQGQLKATTKALEREKNERDAVIDKMKALGSSVSSGLRTDLFGGDVWSGSGSGSGILAGDIGNARSFQSAIKTLKAKGLSGGALAAVLSEGGLQGAQNYADMSAGELREFERLFNLRNRVLRQVGAAAGNAAFGGALRDARQDVRGLERRLDAIRDQLKRNGKNNREDHKQGRNQTKRGAGNGGRNKRRD